MADSLAFTKGHGTENDFVLVPDLEGRGLKVGLDRHGPAFDPDADDRTLDAASVEIARAGLARRPRSLGCRRHAERRRDLVHPSA